MNLKILCVEDNRGDAGLLREILRETGMDTELFFADRLSQACQMLNDASFDVVLLDLTLPDAQGPESVERMKMIAPKVPIVILTGLVDEAIGIQCVQMGAEDYLMKGRFDALLLKRVLRYAIERQHTVADRINLEQTQKAILNILEDFEDQKGELQKEISERTAAQQKLESANRESENFAHIVSHDLKAPLRGMVSLAQWLQDDYAAKLDAKGKEHLHMMIIRAKRMNDMIEGILRYSRIGHLEGEKVRLNLKPLIRNTVDLLAPPPHIAIHISPKMPIVIGDRTRISQLFQNLIGNAMQYMDKPQGNIYVNCVEEKECWKMSVKDNGPGIAPIYHEKIFELFQTLAPKDQTNSTGIGLAVAKKIVETYGGKIWVDSKPGEGSTFFFTFSRKNSVDLLDPELISPPLVLETH